MKSKSHVSLTSALGAQIKPLLLLSTPLAERFIIDLYFYLQGPPQPGQPFKFTVGESCDRIKEEFNFLQAQYHK